MVALKLLTDGSDSVLFKKLVDTGLSSSISVSQEPSKDTNIATIFITLTNKTNHAKMEALVRKIIDEIDDVLIKKQLKTIIARTISEEIFNRDSSLDIAAEFTEYVSAANWPAYFETEERLQSITAKQVKERLTELFFDSNLTIGIYKSI